MLQNALHSSQGLDHVRAVVVEIPQLAIMTLVGPPEGILLENLGGERGEERERREGRGGRGECRQQHKGQPQHLHRIAYMYVQMCQPMHMAWQLCMPT